MATFEQNLAAAKESAAARLAEVLAEQKPTYSVDGQSFSWTEYVRMLTEQIATIDGLLANTAGGLWIGHSQAVT